ncbi:MAG: NUDIX domain-containing protein [Patescibacteria group bacterium]
MDINYDEKSCGLVVYREVEGEKLYLLLHYPGGHWDLVKGHVEEEDANEFETAKRELTEETGIKDVEIVENFRYEVYYEYMKRRKKSRKIVIFFIGKTQEKDVKISHEHKNFIWLPYQKALAKLTFDNAKNLLIKAKNFLED